MHAYEPHEYAARVAVVGAAMAAATEWLNALAAGSEVVSVRRREPLRRALNVPRMFLSKRGLAAFHAASDERRASTLRELSTPSYPSGPAWDEPIATAERLSQFRVSDSSQTRNGSEQVICATGVRKGRREDTLLRDLVETNDLATHGRWLAPAPDSTVEHNRIGETSLRGITMGEMSMGAIRHNDFFAKAKLEGNTVVASPGGIEALDNSTITR